MITHLSQRVIGQPRPIKQLARAFNLAKAGNLPLKGPLFQAVFAGPKGVGKTELAVALADMLWELEKEALARAKERGISLPFSEKDITRSPFIKVPCGDFAGWFRP